VADRHGLAALALHGQPFGFTREDVASLEREANELKAWASAADTDTEGTEMIGRCFILLGIAARIAALLPPETE